MKSRQNHARRQVAVIGAGPAGLLAAERLAASGEAVTVYERMPSAGRRLLMAGRGGLNLTHSEPLEQFLERYGAARSHLAPCIMKFPPAALREWAGELGQETFVGSSGRVFPRAMKASPLLRAWLLRLREAGVEVRLRSHWKGWDETGRLRIEGPDGAEEKVAADAVLLALGGASWPRLGADGSWTSLLSERGVQILPFQPANCGFHLPWSERFRDRFAGSPLKNIALTFKGRRLQGEAVVSSYGLEGSAVYAFAAPLRDALLREGRAELRLDLRPDLAERELQDRLLRVPQSASTANLLRKGAGLAPVAANLLREVGKLDRDPAELARLIKCLPLTLTGVQSLEKAISSAGGIAWSEVEKSFMLRRLPGVFAAGEMLDWEAPTGGYLLQACFATGRAAADGIMRYLDTLG